MRTSLMLLVLITSWPSSAARADDCTGFKWDLSPEYALYAAAPTPVRAGTTTVTLPVLSAGRLYELTLAPLAEVRYALPPGKPMPEDGAFGGMIRFTVPASGDYRIGLDAPFWIDVVAGQQLVQSSDFGGPHGCPKPPHKLVQFTLQGGTSYLLQLSGHAPGVHVSIVKSTPAKP